LSIARGELTGLRDRLRSHSKGHADSVVRYANKLATELDAFDAILARQGIDCLYEGGPGSIKKPEDQDRPPA
jgi:hypothetical protein